MYCITSYDTQHQFWPIPHIFSPVLLNKFYPVGMDERRSSVMPECDKFGLHVQKPQKRNGRRKRVNGPY